MKRPSVTLVMLWQKYRAVQADGYGYSRFCDLYGEWRKTISATMRRTHPVREKLFVDYARDTVPVFDAAPAHIFVAALGASNYTNAEARWSGGSPTGSAPTSTPSRRSAACRRRWCATICGPASPSRRATSPASIAAIRIWRSITALRCCRRVCASRRPHCRGLRPGAASAQRPPPYLERRQHAKGRRQTIRT
jgi:hypothetical protein